MAAAGAVYHSTRQTTMAEDDLFDVHRSLGSTASASASAGEKQRSGELPDFVPAAWLPELVPLDRRQETRAAGPGMPDLLPLGSLGERARHFFPVAFDGAFVPEYSTVTISKDHRPANPQPQAVDRVSMCKCPSQLCAHGVSLAAIWCSPTPPHTQARICI